MEPTDAPIHLLMLSAEYSPEISGGVGTYVQELSDGLSRTGDTVTVLACAFGRAERFSAGSKTVHLLPPDGAMPSGAGQAAIAPGILAYNVKMAAYARSAILADGVQPDLVQCHNWITFPAAYELAHAIGVPVVCNVQYVSDPLERWWGQTPDPQIVAQDIRMFRQGDSFVTVCESMRSIIQSVYRVPDWQIDVITNAVDANAFTRTGISANDTIRLRQALAPHHEKIVLYAGRLHPHKGMSALLASAARVVRQQPTVRYVIAGEPDAPAHARAFHARLDADPLLKAHVVLLGKLTRRRLAAVYSVADVAVVPSVYDPFPFAAIEAMAAGVPVVAARCGGLAEAVQDGVTGFLVPVHGEERDEHCVDVEALAASIATLLQDDELANRFSAAARQRVADLYGIDRMVRLTRAVYHRTLARSRECRLEHGLAG